MNKGQMHFCEIAAVCVWMCLCEPYFIFDSSVSVLLSFYFSIFRLQTGKFRVYGAVFWYSSVKNRTGQEKD